MKNGLSLNIEKNLNRRLWNDEKQENVMRGVTNRLIFVKFFADDL